MADLVLEGTLLGLAGLLEAAAVDVVAPAVEGAADAAVLDASVGERGEAVRAAQPQQSRPAGLVAEQHQVLAHHLELEGLAAGGDLVGEGHGLPIPPEDLAHGGAGPGLREELVLDFRKH